MVDESSGLSQKYNAALIGSTSDRRLSANIGNSIGAHNSGLLNAYAPHNWQQSIQPPVLNVKKDDKYERVTINVLRNGYEVDGFVFHTVLQLSHWLSQNLAPVNADPSKEVA